MFLIAYDIAEPKRLRKTAKILEQSAERCQKSVFLFNGNKDSLVQLLDQAAAHLEPTEDLIQAWRIARTESPDGICRGFKKPAFCNSIFVLDDQITYFT